MWAEANRPDPEATDERPPPHFAVGRGTHFYVGNALARLEAKVVIEELLGRTDTISLDPGEPSSRRPSTMLRRHESLPVIIR